MNEDAVSRSEYEARAREVDAKIDLLRESVDTLREVVDKERDGMSGLKGRLDVYKVVVPLLTFGLGSAITAFLAVAFHV